MSGSVLRWSKGESETETNGENQSKRTGRSVKEKQFIAGKFIGWVFRNYGSGETTE